MARYAGQLLAPAESFGLRPRLFLPFRHKKGTFILFWPLFGHCLCQEATIKKSDFFCQKKGKENQLKQLSSQFCHLRRLFFDQSCQVHPISEFRGGSTSLKNGERRTEILVSNIGQLPSSYRSCLPPYCNGLLPKSSNSGQRPEKTYRMT